jgi:hypothetical protein
MVKWGKKFFILPVIILFFILHSCNNSVEVPSVITVSGQVGLDFGLLEGYKVEIDGQSAVTDINGRFTIGNVLTPYDIKLVNSAGTFAHVYTNITTSNPYFNLGPSSIQNLSSTIGTNINVELPIPPGNNQRIIVKFIPDINEPDAFTQNTTATNTEVLSKVWWNEQTEINGKIAVLYYTKSADKIISYDRFYYKQVTIYDDVPVIYSILPSDQFYSPADVSVSGTVSQNLGNSSHFYLNVILPGAKEQNIYEFIGNSNNFSFIVPQSLPLDYKIKVDAITEYGNDENSHGIIYPQPGTTGNQINMFRAPSLTGLNQNDSTSLYNNLFSWTQGEGSGVYQLQFLISVNTDLSVVTLNTNMLSGTIPDLTSMGFTFPQGAFCRVFIKKIIGINSINDLVDDNLTDDLDYKGSNVSAPVDIRVFN